MTGMTYMLYGKSNKLPPQTGDCRCMSCGQYVCNYAKDLSKETCPHCQEVGTLQKEGAK